MRISEDWLKTGLAPALEQASGAGSLWLSRVARGFAVSLPFIQETMLAAARLIEMSQGRAQSISPVPAIAGPRSSSYLRYSRLDGDIPVSQSRFHPA